MLRWLTTVIALLAVTSIGRTSDSSRPVTLASFQANVTIPLGHRCMGVLPTRSQSIGDPLDAHGFVLQGQGAPIVFVAIDWCEIRNAAYDQWRDALAQAAGTTRERVLVASLHQHDAPVSDAGAAALLTEVGLPGELYDETFHRQAIERVARALSECLPRAQPVTHLGTGAGKVAGIASNRRIEYPDGRIGFDRGSSSGGNPLYSTAPDGEIDPLLKTLSFWNESTPLLALSVYATHPMSHYGKGVVSADFVGLARRRRQAETPGVHQIYASGCSGDVTAGKYNDGSDASRTQLVDRLHQGMTAAWQATRRVPLETLNFRCVPLELEYYQHAGLQRERLEEQLRNPQVRTEDRVLAAMSLSSRDRVERGQPIDLCCLDLGAARLVLFPGESFVGYQLLAQELGGEAFVVSVGYGECWPGYIPTDAAFADGFHDKWLWAAPGSEQRIRQALTTLFQSEASR